MELKDLVGLHVLTGVDYSQESVEHWGVLENASTINFVLDGVTYTAVEDPDDGYRSTMGELKVSQFNVFNTFPGIQVLGRMVENPRRSEDSLIQFISVENGKVILEVGTDYSDSWYPSFVGDFLPANMPLNEEK